MRQDKKHEEAQHLYFQTNMTKSEIADQVGVNRRTIMLWCNEGNWEQLRKSARVMPAMVAEKCYHLIDQYATQLLGPHNGSSTFTPRQADAINKLASAVKKLKNRMAVNESMELFNFFLTGLRKRDEELAGKLLPHIEYYMQYRKGYDTNDFLIDEFDNNGFIPFTNQEKIEGYMDEKDNQALAKERATAATEEEALERWQNPAPEEPPTTASSTEPQPPTDLKMQNISHEIHSTSPAPNTALGTAEGERAGGEVSVI